MEKVLRPGLNNVPVCADGIEVMRGNVSFDGLVDLAKYSISINLRSSATLIKAAQQTTTPMPGQEPANAGAGLKIKESVLLELLTSAHMKGQFDAGCDDPGYSNARADCTVLINSFKKSVPGAS